MMDKSDTKATRRTSEPTLFDGFAESPLTPPPARPPARPRTTPLAAPVRAISVRQPWASAIIHGGKLGPKSVENRSWYTDYRGPLLIHAGSTPPGNSCVQEIALLTGWTAKQVAALPLGAILGVVDLVACLASESEAGKQLLRANRWAECESEFYWQLANPRPFAKPVPYRGQQGFFRADTPEINALVAATMAETPLTPPPSLTPLDASLPVCTSNFSSVKSLRAESPEIIPISIARGTPAWFKGLRDERLAPSRAALTAFKNGEGEAAYDAYLEHYFGVLDKLNAEAVYAELTGGDTRRVALLCWCKRGEFCHRRLAAEWLESHLGIVVPEYGVPRDQTETFLEWSDYDD